MGLCDSSLLAVVYQFEFSRRATICSGLPSLTRRYPPSLAREAVDGTAAVVAGTTRERATDNPHAQASDCAANHQGTQHKKQFHQFGPSATFPPQHGGVVS